MASVEPIALEVYPVWDKQSDEPEEKFLIFSRFFLPLPRANLTECYRRYKGEMGGNGRVNDVPTAFRDDCERYQWRDRHTAYWRWKNHSDQEWREEQIRQYQAQSLDLARLLRVRAVQILENLDIEQTTAKDAAALLRLAGELVNDALDLRDIDKSVRACHRWGLEVSIPADDPGVVFGTVPKVEKVTG